MTKSVGSGVRCQRCNKGVFLTDSNGEIFCSKCGFVATDRIEQEDQNGDLFPKKRGITELGLVRLLLWLCMIWVLQLSLIL